MSPVSVMPAPNQNTAFALRVHRELANVYGKSIAYFHDLDPLSELVSSLLSHRTRNSESAKAYNALVDRFGSWAAVRDAPVATVEEAVRPCTWPEQKAPRLQEVLRQVEERVGTLSLDFLAGMPVTEARAWLEALPGVGPKTSAAVLSFSSLRGRAMPVDSHHFRVAWRLGMVEEKIGEGKAHAVLESLLPETFTAQDFYDHHQYFMRHGQKVCHYRRPACDTCVLLPSCPTGKAAVNGASSAITR